MYVFLCKLPNTLDTVNQHIYITRNFMKYYSKRLIIWRSLVQAQAGPRKAVAIFATAFCLYCCVLKFLSSVNIRYNCLEYTFSRVLFVKCIKHLIICVVVHIDLEVYLLFLVANKNAEI